MSEEYFVFASQLAVISSAGIIGGIYLFVGLLSVLTYGYSKLHDLYNTAIRVAGSYRNRIDDANKAIAKRTNIIGV